MLLSVIPTSASEMRDPDLFDQILMELSFCYGSRIAFRMHSRLPGFAKSILHANHFNGYWLVQGKDFGNGRAAATHYLVLLNCYYGAAMNSRAGNGVYVDRFYSVVVYYHTANAFFFYINCRKQRIIQHR